MTADAWPRRRRVRTRATSSSGREVAPMTSSAPASRRATTEASSERDATARIGIRVRPMRRGMSSSAATSGRSPTIATSGGDRLEPRLAERMDDRPHARRVRVDDERTRANVSSHGIGGSRHGRDSLVAEAWARWTRVGAAGTTPAQAATTTAGSGRGAVGRGHPVRLVDAGPFARGESTAAGRAREDARFRLVLRQGGGRGRSVSVGLIGHRGRPVLQVPGAGARCGIASPVATP